MKSTPGRALADSANVRAELPVNAGEEIVVVSDLGPSERDASPGRARQDHDHQRRTGPPTLDEDDFNSDRRSTVAALSLFAT
jgi:hypothetical protein